MVNIQPIKNVRRVLTTRIRRINSVGVLSMLRDIDYAATAVKTAILEKFGRQQALEDLQVIAHERTISVQHGQHIAEGTRDSLLATLRKSGSYDQFWKMSSATPA